MTNMTKRELFAKVAMESILRIPRKKWLLYGLDKTPSSIAKLSVDIADALIEALKKK